MNQQEVNVTDEEEISHFFKIKDIQDLLSRLKSDFDMAEI